MQKILSRRVFRDLKSNCFRYLALFLLIVLGMYMIISIVGAAETVIRGVEKGQRENCLEDGQFGVFVPLNDTEVTRIQDAGITLEKGFYMDYRVEESTLRIYKNREQMNLFSAAEGKNTADKGEILLEQHYAQAHGLKPGDELVVGNLKLKIAGIGSTPDYDAVFNSLSDTSVDSDQFGTAFVSAEDYSLLKEEGGSFKTEEYVYSYRLNGNMTDDELKELIQSFELDREQVTDTYFLEMLEEAEQTKNDIQDGISELLEGCEELSDGLFEIADNNEDVNDAADSLFEAMLEQVNDGLEESGIHVVLKEESFEKQLDEMIASPGKYSADMRQELKDAKEQLESLDEFRQGVKTYTEGVSQAADGSNQLRDGLSTLTDHNAELINGSDAVFHALLGQANSSLQELGQAMGFSIVLTAEEYEAQLDSLIAAYGGFSPELAASLEGTKEQLKSIASFGDGLKSYMGGVCAAEGGSGQLSAGLGEISNNNSALVDGAEAVFDALVEMVNQQLKESGLDAEITKDNFAAGLEELAAPGSKVDRKLKESLRDTREMLIDLREFQDGIREYTDGVQEAAEGSLELVDGVEELKKEADDMLEEYFTFDIDNLTSFVPREDNPRVSSSVNDVLINKYVGMIAGVIIMALFTYVISVFVVHNIEQESSVIGTLYALGVKRQQLIRHYLLLPVAVTFLGGLAGGGLGFSPIGIDWQMADSVNYFSMPVLKVQYPMYLILYGFVMPPLVAAAVNYLVINKKLKRTALSLIRKEQKGSRIKDINLGHMKFVRRFQIRQILREMRSGLAVVTGMFISLLVLMMAVDCYVLVENYMLAADRETKYGYLYTYKYPTEEVPAGGTEGYMESLKKEAYGYDLDVSIIGLTENNPYYDIDVSEKKNEIVISSAAASKFNLKVGEKMVLSDEVNEQDYAFTVVRIVPYTSGISVFMDIDAMRELFDQEDDYYNVVFSDQALDVENGRLYAATSRESVKAASEVFVNMMWPMIIMMSVIAIIIFAVVMYLMMKVMIDRSAFSISLMKVFGYRKREIKKLYLDGNFMIVAVGALICVPLSKYLMDLMYPYFISNVAIGMDLTFSWQLYAGIYVGILVCYMIINQMLVRRLKKMVPAEVLKNRE